MLKLLVLLAASVIPFVTSFHSILDESNSIDNSNEPNSAVSSDMFTLYNLYTQTVNGEIYLVKKNGGSDDGQLYAMKIQDVTQATILESDTLAAVRESPWVTKLHYSFIRGKKHFIVMDFGIGGSVDSRLRFRTFLRPVNKPNATIAKLIAAELVAAALSVHSFNVVHLDTQRANMVIDSDGHLLLTDFGFAQWLTDDKITQREWRMMIRFFIWIFPKPIIDEDQISFLNLLNNMTDAQISELKNHTYFNGIDWKKMARRECEPPFEATETQIKLTEPMHLKTLFPDDEVDAAVLATFGNYVYVAPEHQN